jgi:hypothetical protein
MTIPQFLIFAVPFWLLTGLAVWALVRVEQP